MLLGELIRLGRQHGQGADTPFRPHQRRGKIRAAVDCAGERNAPYREARLHRRVGDQQRLRLEDRVLVRGRKARNLRPLEAEPRLEPQAICVEKAKIRVRRAGDLRCHANDFVERRVGGRVENFVLVQRLQPVSFTPLSARGQIAHPSPQTLASPRSPGTWMHGVTCSRQNTACGGSRALLQTRHGSALPRSGDAKSCSMYRLRHFPVVTECPACQGTTVT